MNSTEFFIKRLYEAIYINDPYQLCIDKICNRLQLEINYWKFTSAIVELKGKYKVFINENLNLQQQWQDFGHEMKHYFFDGGSQLYLTDQFLGYQETKADYFAYHFCVPTFMLMNIKGVTVNDVMNLFNVEFDFALRRLEMYKNKMIGRVAENAGAYY